MHGLTTRTAMTPYPPEIENLDSIRRELFDGMNRIDRIRKKRMGEGRRCSSHYFIYQAL